MNIQQPLYALCVQAVINQAFSNTREIISNTIDGKDLGRGSLFQTGDHFII